MDIGRRKLFLAKEAVDVYLWEGFLVKVVEEDARFFLEGVAALRHSFNLSHIFFYFFLLQKTTYFRKLYIISGSGGAEGLHFPRSTPW